MLAVFLGCQYSKKRLLVKVFHPGPEKSKTEQRKRLTFRLRNAAGFGRLHSGGTSGPAIDQPNYAPKLVSFHSLCLHFIQTLKAALFYAQKVTSADWFAFSRLVPPGLHACGARLTSPGQMRRQKRCCFVNQRQSKCLCLRKK